MAGTLLAAREAVMSPIRPYLREAGVTEQQWRVLRVLADGGELDLSSLAEAALLHPPSVTRILKDLVDRRLIRRDSDQTDGRRSLVRLTDAGRALMDHTAAFTSRLVDRNRSAFGADRLANLQRELKELTSALRKAHTSD
ncbi:MULTISPECIES: homoprotocatechuate degradation operon regulator HpaR [unclassified Sphingomonas]|uniref:homoprotocatechuate degradation operon regulator HpaR n=1 Tax=unclassified Sphingomonas TaxID=196159 RepID=UPI001F1D7848|nr:MULTISPECIES: homoprotocatechuate degradation operon regulator HpaR [unclassified Sphingomonas]